MQISSIGAIRPFIKNSQSKIAFGSNNLIHSDSFEKRAETKHSDNEAINWLNNSDFIKKEFAQTLADEKNKIGQGFQHRVYAIKGKDDYVLRVPNYFNTDSVDLSKYEVADTRDKSLKVNIGQEVAQIIFPRKDGLASDHVSILRRQSGLPVGVPPFEAISYESGKLKDGEAEYDSKINKDKYAASIKALSDMPVSAYEKLLDDLAHTTEKGYYFDYLNSNNLMYDEADKTISLIDMDKDRAYLNYANVLYALTNINYYSTYTGSYGHPVSQTEKFAAIDNTVKIIDKYFQAMKNKGLKFDRENCSFEFLKLFLSVPFCLYCETADDNKKWQKLIDMGVTE